MNTSYTIQQVAGMTGLSPHTLRYYEKAGLIRTVGRDGSGYRLYSENDVEWLRFLIRLRDTGMPIRQMQQFAELRYRGDETVGERRRLLDIHKEEVLQQIGRLTEALEAIERKSEYYKEMERQQGRQT
ncbi:MerR family transcriptional regulator [Paenibacillus hamazuiensis]|uniref:MerR family transcriptional regulator n=1 Tax=Paenibacillus hamazuiensis TaxID=2936508 RepID=UPI0023DED470|nr:MerR family transcriptional regulator [Paenibacillus hamazuiensis]